MRARIFRKARLLSQEQRTRRVFISQDLTPQQREDQKAESERKAEAARKTEEAKNAGRRETFVVVGTRGRSQISSRKIMERTA